MRLSSAALPFRGTAWYGWSMALLVTLFFSIGPATTKFILSTGVDPVTLMVLRYVAATLLLFSTIGLISPQRLRIDRHGLQICLIAGLLFSLSFLLFATALTRISASVASIIVATYPLIVLGILALRGEKFTYRNIIRLGLGLSGVYLLIGVGGRVDFLGTVMVLGTSLTFAIYLVIIQTLKDYVGQTVMLYVFATIALFSIGLWLARGGQGQMPTLQGWLGIAVLVIFTSYIAQLALFVAVRHLGSGQMALLNPLEIFLTVMWAMLFLHERLTAIQWVGSGLILFSMALAIKRIRRTQRMSWRSRLRLRL